MKSFQEKPRNSHLWGRRPKANEEKLIAPKRMTVKVNLIPGKSTLSGNLNRWEGHENWIEKN